MTHFTFQRLGHKSFIKFRSIFERFEVTKNCFFNYRPVKKLDCDTEFLKTPSPRKCEDHLEITNDESLQSNPRSLLKPILELTPLSSHLQGGPYVFGRFLKVGVASKWVKPRLRNFLCFLGILMAKISENLVAIVLTISLSMAFLCHMIKGIGGHE